MNTEQALDQAITVALTKGIHITQERKVAISDVE